MKLEPHKVGETTLWRNEQGWIYSVDPPDAYFNISPFCFMIPFNAPKKVLIIGVAKNTIGRLLKQVKPSIEEMVLVDIDPVEGDEETIAMDGLEYLKSCPDNRFDFVIVDAFDGIEIPKHFFAQEFVDELHRVTRHAVMNMSIQHEAAGMVRLLSTKFKIMHINKWHGNVCPICIDEKFFSGDLCSVLKRL